MQMQSTFSERPLYVVGAGAIGRVVTGILDAVGADPTLICRSQTAANIAKGGYNFITNGDQVKSITPNVLSYEQVSQHVPNDAPIIFYATKATYLAETVPKVAVLFDSQEADHMFLQGGIPWWFGHIFPNNDLAAITDPYQIKTHIGDLSRVHAGMIKFGATRDDQDAHLKGRGLISFGSIERSEQNSALCKSLKDTFAQSNLVKTSVADDLTQTIFAKAAGSFAMSIMALIHDIPLGPMYDNEEIRSEMIESANIIAAVGREIGLENNTDYEIYFEGIARDKPQHMMSITNDASEIAQIIEWPIAIGKKLGMNVSILEELYESIPDIYKPSIETPYIAAQ